MNFSLNFSGLNLLQFDICGLTSLSNNDFKPYCGLTSLLNKDSAICSGLASLAAKYLPFTFVLQCIMFIRYSFQDFMSALSI